MYVFIKANFLRRFLRACEKLRGHSVHYFEVTRTLIGSRSNGQVYAGTDWLRGLHENIGALNRNIQHNVMQLNQRIQETVQANSAQIHRVTEKLNEELGTVEFHLNEVVVGTKF